MAPSFDFKELMRSIRVKPLYVAFQWDGMGREGGGEVEGKRCTCWEADGEESTPPTTYHAENTDSLILLGGIPGLSNGPLIRKNIIKMSGKRL